ncbi:MAG: hybrid sensor histidine kinase/response regulator [Comamonadaceae bacterium]|nr:hybrid sensor histidine kinase/response regulator [Comamonadaceae bacterium]
MSDEDQEHLFEPFYSGFENGRGLGLSIVRKIVDDYDGRIDVRSEPGQGTEVAITLPPRAGRRAGKGEAMETILIIDDEKSLLDLLTVVFKKEGYAVKSALSAAARLRDPGQGGRSTSSSPTSRCPAPTAWTSSATPGRTCPTCRSS